MSEERKRFDLLLIGAGGIIWAVRFAAVYSVAAVACARDWAEPGFAGLPAASWFITATTIVAVIANLAVIIYAVKRQNFAGNEPLRLTRAGTIGLALLSILAISWETAVLSLPACL